MSLIIGASGSIGKNLAKALAQRGDYVVAGLRKSPLPADLATMITAQEFGVDVREPETIKAVFAKHPQIKIVWNLAAPLSVETAKNPHVAHKIVVGGMENVLNAMDESGVKRIVFSDSIGSLGATAPREECPASWLPANPQQDPGSDYGVQKRACRDLMRELGVKIRLRNLFLMPKIIKF